MINITRGNALSLLATFTRGGEPYKFSGMKSVRLLSRFGRAYALSFTYKDGRCVCALPDTLPTGEYSFEATGTENGQARRTMFARMLRVTEVTERGGDDTAEGGADDYDIAVSLSLLPTDGGAAVEHVSVATFLSGFANGTLDATTLYAVAQPSFTEDETSYGDTVATFMGQKRVSGLDAEELRDLPVAWSDPSMRACAIIAKAEAKATGTDGEATPSREAYTYRDLINMDTQGLGRMISYYKVPFYPEMGGGIIIVDTPSTEEGGEIWTKG